METLKKKILNRILNGISRLDKKSKTENQGYSNRNKKAYVFCTKVFTSVTKRKSCQFRLPCNVIFFKLLGLLPHRSWNVIVSFGRSKMIFIMPRDPEYLYPFEWQFCYKMYCRVMHAKDFACFPVFKCRLQQ